MSYHKSNLCLCIGIFHSKEKKFLWGMFKQIFGSTQVQDPILQVLRPQKQAPQLNLDLLLVICNTPTLLKVGCVLPAGGQCTAIHLRSYSCPLCDSFRRCAPLHYFLPPLLLSLFTPENCKRRKFSARALCLQAHPHQTSTQREQTTSVFFQTVYNSTVYMHLFSFFRTFLHPHPASYTPSRRGQVVAKT